MASPTPNKGYTYPAHGGSVNSWDTAYLNPDIDQIDLNFGGVYNVVTADSTASGAPTFNSTYCVAGSTVTTITFPTSIAQNMYYNVTGATTAVVSLQFPGVGSFYIVNNATSGSGINFVTATSTTSPATATAGLQIVVTDGTNAKTATPPSAEFASGTGIIFAQAAAPSGWTQTSLNDYMLRLTSGAGTGTGGAWTISGGSVGSHTLTTSEIPSHNHSYQEAGGSAKTGNNNNCFNSNSGNNTGNAGGGGSHSHTLSFDGSWRPQYYNVIRATKN